jgi:quercetin dioxygenase-like cupin family protein
MQHADILTQQESFLLKPTESRHGQPYNVLGMRVYLKISDKDTRGRMSMFFSEYRQNEGPPLHRHNVDETFYVTEGEFIFQTGEVQVRAGTGDTIFIPANMPHAFLTLSETGTLLFTVCPTDTVETFFERLTAYPEMPLEEVVRLNEELGMQILGPPLPATL